MIINKMGFGCFKPNLPPEVEEILKEVADKGPEITNTFIIEDQKLKKELNDLLTERHEKVKAALNNKNQKIEEVDLSSLLLDYNLKEIDNEKEMIVNKTDQLHILYEFGLEQSDKLKEETIKNLEEKLKDAPSFTKEALNKQIEEIKNYSSKDFLNSSYGKPLKTVLEKQGLRENCLQEYMEGLRKQRLIRRKLEREEFNIKVNEFPPKDELQFTAEDLFEAIQDEYKDEFKSEIKKKIINKVL